MTENGSEGGESRPEEVAAYIGALTAEMVRLARKHKLTELAYLLDVARLEALQQSQTRRRGPSTRIA